MGYTHRGAIHDLGDQPTKYGMNRVDEYDRLHKENERKAKELYQKEIMLWKKEYTKVKLTNDKLKKEYAQKLKEWDNHCKGSILGFIKRILSVGKPNLELLRAPKKPVWDYHHYIDRVS